MEAEFTDILDPAMCAASSWVAQASPVDTMRMHNLETAEASIAKDHLAESGSDAVRTGMATKPVSVRHKVPMFFQVTHCSPPLPAAPWGDSVCVVGNFSSSGTVFRVIRMPLSGLTQFTSQAW